MHPQSAVTSQTDSHASPAASAPEASESGCGDPLWSASETQPTEDGLGNESAGSAGPSTAQTLEPSGPQQREPERILFVDDDVALLEALRRQFRRHYEITLACGGREGLEFIRHGEPFAVIVSDQSMPGMKGVEFLAEAQRLSPDSVRIMLTGNADQQTAIQAVNEGRIFRFLSKPVTRETMRMALEAGIEQYRLVTSHRVLLTQTLQGAVKVLMDVLALNSAEAFGHGARLKQLVSEIVAHMQAEPAWQIQLAAMLSPIGCVTVPPEILRRVHGTESISPNDWLIYAEHARAGHDLIANIPRMEEVARIVLYQHKNYDGSGFPPDDCRGNEIPLGARIIHVASDYELWLGRGCTSEGALLRMRNSASKYDPEVLEAFEAVVGHRHAQEQNRRSQSVRLAGLKPGMIVARDVRTADGSILLLKEGQQITPVLLSRLRNFARHTRVLEPIEVLELDTPLFG